MDRLDSRLLVSLVLGVSLMGGCRRRPVVVEKSSLELQTLQSRTLGASKEVVFRSAMSVFQDKGYTINSADLQTGMIAASSAVKTTDLGRHGSKIQSERATAVVEELADGKTLVRVNFVGVEETSGRDGQRGQTDTPALDPQTYTYFFSKLDEAIFIRKATH